MCPKFKRYRNPSQLPQADLPEHAVKFREPGNFFELSVASLPFLIPVAALLYLCVRLKGVSPGEMGSLLGVVLATAAVVPHELLHAVAFPKGSEISFWYYPEGLTFFVYSTAPLSKKRFILMCLLPALVLGVLPLLLWLIVPADVKWLSRFLFTFAALGLLYGAGDYVNAFNAAVQMPRSAVTCLSGFHSYWYIPKTAGDKGTGS